MIRRVFINSQVLSFAIVAVVSGTEASAQACPLPSPDVLIGRTDSSSKHAASDFACFSSFREHSNAYGGKASGNYKLIGGSGSYNQENYEQWKESSCDAGNVEDYKTSYAYNMQTTFGRNQVEAYEICQKSKLNLFCSLARAGDNVIVEVNWRLGAQGRLSEAPIVTNARLNGGLTEEGDTIATGTKVSNLSIQDPNRWTTYLLNVSTSDDDLSCSLAISPVPSTPDVPVNNQFSGKLDQPGSKSTHSFEALAGDIVEIRPVLLSDDSLYFDMKVFGPDGSTICSMSRWLGSSGETNGMVFPATDGEHELQITMRPDGAGAGMYKILVSRDTEFSPSVCAQISDLK